MTNVPVIGGKREDNVRAFGQWDMSDQGPGSCLDGFEERQKVILSGPAHDVVYRGVETEVLLWSGQ